MLTHTRLSAAEVAMLTIFLVTEYDNEKGKKTTRTRISQTTLRVISDRQRLRASLIEDWIDELSNLGWSAFPVGDNFAIIQTEAVEGWVRISAKRIRPTLRRISLGDGDALKEVAKAVLPEIAMEDNEED